MASLDKRHDRNQEATVWIGGLDTQCTEEIVWELMLQCGPVVDVTMPRDKVTGMHQGYAFCEFQTREDAEYAMRIMNMVKLYGKHIRINKAAADKKEEEESFAILFVGNLDPEVDEKILYDTFSQFGAVLSAKIMTKNDSNESRQFGFVTFESFEASDSALAAMNGQFLCNRPLHVSYAYKKDTAKRGERHGTPAERLLAKKKQEEMGTTQIRPPVARFGFTLPAIPMGRGRGVPPRPPLPVGGPGLPPLPPVVPPLPPLPPVPPSAGRGAMPPVPALPSGSAPTPPIPPLNLPPLPPIPGQSQSGQSSQAASQSASQPPRPPPPPSIQPEGKGAFPPVVPMMPMMPMPPIPPMFLMGMGRGLPMPPMPPPGAPRPGQGPGAPPANFPMFPPFPLPPGQSQPGQQGQSGQSGGSQSGSQGPPGLRS